MSSVIWSLNRTTGRAFRWGYQAGRGTHRTSGPDTPFGVIHQEMLVEGGKLKELAEEESIKSSREQRKVNFWEEREKEPGIQRKKIL